MLWLTVTIVAYLILALVYLVDKYLLTGPIPNPKVYAFYIGLLGLGVLVFIPFIDFYVFDVQDIILAFISGASFVWGIFWFFKGLKQFEPSRMVPAVGGILPIFTFILIYIFSWGSEILGSWQILAFILLILGTILITYQKSKRFSLKSIQLSVIAAFFLALSFVFAKFVYNSHPFLLSLVWIRLGGVLMALAFLSSSELRKGLFKQEMALEKKTIAIFFSSQAAGAGANILQNWAVALIYVAFINALQGIQYAFLLVFAVLFSWKFPKVLKEEISKEVIFQKIIAILLISFGLVILSIK